MVYLISNPEVLGFNYYLKHLVLHRFMSMDRAQLISYNIIIA